MRIDTSDIDDEVLDAPVTKREFSMFLGMLRVQALMADNAIMAAYRQDREKLLEYIKKLEELYGRIDREHNRMLGRPEDERVDEN